MSADLKARLRKKEDNSTVTVSAAPWRWRNPDGPEAAERIEALEDSVFGLTEDLRSAVRVAYWRGATEWARLNYPDWVEALERSDEG